MASLPTLSDPFYQNNPNDPASAFYVPPAGYYQNDAGKLVPNSTPATNYPTTASALAGTQNTTPSVLTNPVGAVKSAVSQGLSAINPLNDFLSSYDLEDLVFMLLGLVLIIAGVFSFRGVSDNINSASNLYTKYAPKSSAADAAEVAAL